MKFAICILCNNVFYLQNIIDNFQYKNNKSIDLIIINETRIKNLLNEFKEICKDINNIILIDGKNIIDRFKTDIIDTKFVDIYTMGLNILQNWYVFKYMNYDKVIVVDDDVIINNLDNIFKYDESLFYKFRLSAGGKTYNENSLKYKKLIKTYCDIFDLEINSNNYADLWIDNHINAGERMYTKKDFNIREYEEYLKRFYANSGINYFWNIRKKPGSYYLDEWFESFFAYKTGIINDILRIEKLAFIEIRNNDKINFEKYTNAKDYPIWHNATCSHKKDWLKILKEYNIIN